MKKLITNNWQKILIGICGIVLILILVGKFIAPKTLIPDYIKYGKVVTPLEGTSEVIDSAKENVRSVWSSVDPNFARLFVVMMVAILIVVFLSEIAAKAGGGNDAKKKK